MNVIVCKCRECGRYHVFEKFGVRDIHVCECGEKIERWTHELPECEVKAGPSEPYRKEPMEGQDHRKTKYPVKGITVQVDCKTTDSFNETMDKLREAQQLVCPVIVKDNTKALLFQTDINISEQVITELNSKFFDRLGIECYIMGKGIKLAGIINE